MKETEEMVFEAKTKREKQNEFFFRDIFKKKETSEAKENKRNQTWFI